MTKRKSDETVLRTIIVGDIHGCLSELNTLLKKLNPSSQDTFIFLGDLVDRGPDSIGVVRLLNRFSKQFRLILVRGNHEDAHLRWLKHKQSGKGIEQTMSNHNEISSIQNRLSEDEQSFLLNSVPYVRIPGDNIAVHAGFPSSMNLLPADTFFSANTSPQERRSYEILQRLRYESYEGNFVSFGHLKTSDTFWADDYDGRFGHAFFGHHAFIDENEPVKFKNATGLDLGCVYGNRLACTVLTNSSVEFITAEAEVKYFTSL